MAVIENPKGKLKCKLFHECNYKGYCKWCDKELLTVQNNCNF